MSLHWVGKFGGVECFTHESVPLGHFTTLPGRAKLLIDYLNPHCLETPVPEDLNPKAQQAIADGKLPLHLIDTAMTHPASRVLAHGAEKYGVRNWRKVPINASTYIGALRRHTDEWADGADVDHDSGEHPLAHIIATCNVVLDAIKYGTLVDDRLDAEAKTSDPTTKYNTAACKFADNVTCEELGCSPCGGCRS